jgi:hypothetical protein
MAKHNGARIYSAYKFTEKDPAIYQLQQFLGDTKLTQVTKDGGPSTTCMRSWFHGETKRPQNATIEAAGRALGYERVWKHMRRKA